MYLGMVTDSAKMHVWLLAFGFWPLAFSTETIGFG